VPPPIRGGIYCSTSPTGGGTVDKQVPLDTTDTSYPYSSRSGSALIVRGTGPILIVARCTMASGTCTATLRINGTTVATGTTALASTITYAYNAARGGDLLTLWETDSGFGGVLLTSGAANTFLHYEVPTEPVPINTTTPSRSALY
jgi:hypothetical protein